MIDSLMDYDDTEHLSGITARTLLLWGNRDALFPRAHQDRIAAALPNAELKVYPETGHCPNWGRPELVARRRLLAGELNHGNSDL